MEMPKSVAIPENLYKKLQEGSNKLQALEDWTKMVVHTGEQRKAEIQQELREAWIAIAKETEIDIENIAWQPHPTKMEIVPVSMSLHNVVSKNIQ